MTGKAGDMMYKSRIPALLGKKQAEENRIITAPEIAEETGLTRQTVVTWLNPKNEFANLNATVADAFMRYFRVPLSELVEIVKKSA